MKPTALYLLGLFLFASCASYSPDTSITQNERSVRQQDLDAWVGVSVDALDTHSFFTTVPMKEVKTKDGFTYRFYNNSKTFTDCTTFGNTSAQVSAFPGAYSNPSQAYGSANNYNNTSCGEVTVGCNNVFMIKDGIVKSYTPKGRCYTDETVIPEGRYRKVASAHQEVQESPKKKSGNKKSQSKK